jgi:hypothetical protein
MIHSFYDVQTVTILPVPSDQGQVMLGKFPGIVGKIDKKMPEFPHFLRSNPSLGWIFNTWDRFSTAV